MQLKNSIINILSGALGFTIPILLNLVLTPIIVKQLGSEAYGLQSLVNIIIGFMMIADLGLDIPVTRSVASLQASNDFKGLNKLLNTTLQLYLIIGFIGCIIVLISSKSLVEQVFNVSANYKESAIIVFNLSAIGFLGSLFSMWGKSIFNGFSRYDISNGISLLGSVLSIGIGGLLVLYGYGVVTYVFVRVLMTFLTGIAYLLMSKSILLGFKLRIGIDKEVWNKIKLEIGYGFVLRIAGVLTSRIDSTLIGIWVGLSAVGYYTVGILIVTSLSGLISSMSHFIFPKVSEYYALGKKVEIEDLFYSGCKYISILIFLIFSPLILFSFEFLKLWMGDSVANASSSIFMMLLISTGLSLLFTTFLNLYIVGIGKLKLFSLYTIIRGSIMGITCLILIKPYGIIGAGYASLLAVIADILFFIHVMYTHSFRHVLNKLLIIYLKLLIIVLLIEIPLHFLLIGINMSWMVLISITIFFVLIFAFFTYLFGIWKDDELEKISLVTKKWRNLIKN